MRKGVGRWGKRSGLRGVGRAAGQMLDEQEAQGRGQALLYGWAGGCFGIQYKAK